MNTNVENSLSFAPNTLKEALFQQTIAVCAHYVFGFGLLQIGRERDLFWQTFARRAPRHLQPLNALRAAAIEFFGLDLRDSVQRAYVDAFDAEVRMMLEHEHKGAA